MWFCWPTFFGATGAQPQAAVGGVAEPVGELAEDELGVGGEGDQGLGHSEAAR